MPEARALWSAAASWIKEGTGCGRAVAELMSGRVTAVDVHEADAARFYPYQQTAGHVRGRAREPFNKMYGIVGASGFSISPHEECAVEEAVRRCGR